MSDKKREFEEGDVARLKSGGPNMTVGYDKLEGYVECVWFDAVAGEFKRDAFRPGVLELVYDEEIIDG